MDGPHWYRKYQFGLSAITIVGVIVTLILLIIFVYLVYRRAVKKTELAQQNATVAAKAGCELIIGANSTATSIFGSIPPSVTASCRALLAS